MEEKKKDYRVLIIDIETTHLSPKSGFIAEIGLVELDLETGEKKILLDRLCHEKGMTADHVNKSWIVSNGYITTEEIRTSQSLGSMQGEIQFIIDGYPNGATAFNRQFDFGFLEARGFTFPKKLDCPMLLSTSICAIPHKNGRGTKWPKVEEAYKHFFPYRRYNELHRGADDAFHEADIVKALFDLGVFKIK